VKIRPILARLALVAGVAGVASIAARGAPHEQTLVIRLGDRDVAQVAGVVTELGQQEPTAGFSRDFPATSPRSVRHTFSAPHGQYSVSVTFRVRARAGDAGPIHRETSFERRVNLAGGEVVLSPD